jgi:hypothetical protein
MHATLLTVLLVAGGQQPAADVPMQPIVVTKDCGGTDCRRCLCAAGCRGWAGVWGCLAACCGPMPQTCCAPRFGCCPGNDRYMHRSPAYYRQAYNYRQLFDYPWHATPHQPQPFFSYRRPRPSTEEVIPTPYPQPESVPFESLPLTPDSP